MGPKYFIIRFTRAKKVGRLKQHTAEKKINLRLELPQNPDRLEKDLREQI